MSFASAAQYCVVGLICASCECLYVYLCFEYKLNRQYKVFSTLARDVQACNWSNEN